MTLVCVHDRDEIERLLRGDVYLHIYSIGDLDAFFWPYTLWYGWQEADRLSAIALLYIGLPLPTLLALTQQTTAMQRLLASILHLLPQRFYCHLSPGLEAALEKQYRLQPHGEHYKLALKDRQLLRDVDCADVLRMTHDDIDDILQLYRQSYPGNWFDPRMLDTNQYFGIRQDGRLVSVAGIHVYSKQYKVAALGNVTTHPGYRNRGHAKRTTARLCQSLLEHIDHIGANVKADNLPAIRLYEGLGFEVAAPYREYMAERA